MDQVHINQFLFIKIFLKIFSKKLKVTTLKNPKNLVTASGLRDLLFDKSYGQDLINSLIDKGKIKHKEIGLSHNAWDDGKTKLYSKITRKQFTKLTGVTIFDPDKYVSRKKFLKNIFGRSIHTDYFLYCEKKINKISWDIINSRCRCRKSL